MASQYSNCETALADLRMVEGEPKDLLYLFRHPKKVAFCRSDPTQGLKLNFHGSIISKWA